MEFEKKKTSDADYMKIIKTDDGYSINGVKFTELQIKTFQEYNRFTSCKNRIVNDMSIMLSDSTFRYLSENDELLNEMTQAYLDSPILPEDSKANLFYYIKSELGFKKKIEQAVVESYRKDDTMGKYVEYADKANKKSKQTERE